MELTQEILKTLLEYRDGKLYWLKNRTQNVRAGDEAGYIAKMKTGPRYKVTVLDKEYLRSRLIFFYFNGYFPEMVDHKNSDPLDDSIDNLRAATRSENNRNRKSAHSGTSKYLGVHLSHGKYWTAQILSNGQKKHIGRFKTAEDAAVAYNEKAIELHGEFAKLNIFSL